MSSTRNTMTFGRRAGGGCCACALSATQRRTTLKQARNAPHRMDLVILIVPFFHLVDFAFALALARSAGPAGGFAAAVPGHGYLACPAPGSVGPSGNV